MTLTVTAVMDSNYPPRVAVSVSSSPAVSGRLTVTRTHADGSVHPVLTDQDPVLVTSWAGFDYHCPFNQVVTYTAATTDQSGSSSAVFLPSDLPWLIHPSDPTLSFPAELLRVDGSIKFSSPAKTYPVLNRRLPVVRTAAPRGGESGNLRVKVMREDETAARALFAAGGAVLLNGAWGDNDHGWKWILPGELTITNPGGFIDFPHRWFDVSYQECADPDVDVVSPWNFDALEDAYVDFDTAAAAYPDFDSMALGS